MSSVSQREQHFHTLGDFEALRSSKAHGEFRVTKDDKLYVANDGFLGRKVKGLDVGPGAKAERAAALVAFEEALINHGKTQTEAQVLIGTITAGHRDRLNVTDLDQVWSQTRPPAKDPPASSASSKSEPKGFSPLHGREQAKSQLASPEGVKATKQMETALAGVAEDERLLELIDNNKLSFGDRVKQNGLTSAKFYAGLVPFLGAGIKGADAHAASKELRALKSMRDDLVVGGEPQPLLSACIDGLEDHSRVKRNKNAISAGLDIATKPVVYATGGVAAPVAEAVTGAMSGVASEAISYVTSEVTGQGVGLVSGKAADIGVSKSGQAQAERHVEKLQTKPSQVVGSGDQATRLSDYRAVRALLIYLGPADQSEEIRADKSISSEKRDALLKQEESRLTVKEQLGSPRDEDLTKGLKRTKDDDHHVDELSKRDKSGKVWEKDRYLSLRDTDTESAPSPLRTLWMLEGWIGTDNQLEKAVSASKEKMGEAAKSVSGAKEGVRDRIDPTRYHKLEES